jgi:DNA-binding response OmpR family regulator
VPRVSVVHRSDVVRALVGEILSAEGFEPIGAATVEDALALMWVDPPVLAVVDEDLVGGFLGLPVPWIALGRRGHGATVAAAGASCVVQKPFVPGDLVRAVAWALDVYASPARRS